MNRLPHEELPAYEKALELTTLAGSVAMGLYAAGADELAEHLQRAAEAVPVSIARHAATGPDSPVGDAGGPPSRHIAVCAAVLDICAALEVSRPETLRRVRELLLEVTCALPASMSEPRRRGETG